MEWFNNLISSLGNIFSPGSSTPSQTNTSIWPSLISSATNLIGSYYTQSQNSSITQQYIQQQQAALAAQAEQAEKDRAAELQKAAMYSGAQVKAAAIAAGAAKKNTLAGLYNNWANARQRGGEVAGQEAQNIGAMIGGSLNARQASLK